MEKRNTFLLLTAWRFLSALFGPALLLAGCSSLLYHPSHEQLRDPKDYGLAPRELRIAGLHAWHFKSKAARPRGLVIFFHGNAENLTSHFASLSFLPEEGFEYLIFDYRGYGKSPLSPGLSHSTPRSTVEDGAAALSWAISECQDRKLPLIVYGQSLGGAVALRALEDLGPRISAVRLVVLESTFASYVGAGNSALSRSWVTWPLQWLSGVLLSDEFAPQLNHPWGSHPPEWLVLHGTEDATISATLGRDLFAALPEPKTLVIAAGAGHIQSLWIRDPKGHYPYRERVLAALNRVTGNPYPSFEPLELLPPFVPAPGIRLLQGAGGGFSHQGEQYHALDFAMPEGTPVRAMRAGQVLQVIQHHTEGGPSDQFATRANLILVEHSDGTLAEYVHLAPRSARVSVGQKVRRGQELGLSGNTGFTTEPHLHVRIYTSLGSVPLVFESPTLQKD